MNDPFGEAIKEFFKKGKAPDLKVNSNYTENETIPVAYLFRDEDEMPKLEKTALKNCKGQVLDVGAAAGCHSILLQKKGFNVTALEKSELACDTMQKRGIIKIVNADVFEYNEKQFSTILMLMNGAGIGGTLSGLKKLLIHIKSLLLEGGQILIDSSDIKYLFEEEDGSLWVDLSNDNYYGEMQYNVSFRKAKTSFDWLFVDFDRLKSIAQEAGLNCTRIAEGEHYDYLARLTHAN